MSLFPPDPALLRQLHVDRVRRLGQATHLRNAQPAKTRRWRRRDGQV